MDDIRKFALEEASRLVANTASGDLSPEDARNQTVKTAEAFAAFLEVD